MDDINALKMYCEKAPLQSYLEKLGVIDDVFYTGEISSLKNVNLYTNKDRPLPEFELGDFLPSSHVLEKTTGDISCFLIQHIPHDCYPEGIWVIARGFKHQEDWSQVDYDSLLVAVNNGSHFLIQMKGKTDGVNVTNQPSDMSPPFLFFSEFIQNKSCRKDRKTRAPIQPRCQKNAVLSEGERENKRDLILQPASLVIGHVGLDVLFYDD